MKETQMSEIVTQTLGINCAMTMIFGGTIIDTDPAAGYDNSEMEAIRKPCDKTPEAALKFFPEAISVERESGTEDDNNLSLASVWLNGFIPFSRGLPDPENMSRSCETYLKSQNIVTTDQCFLSRPEGWMESLFWHFKWFNSDDRIIEEDFVREEILNKLISKGLVCHKWQHQSPEIRYMVREKSDSDEVPDYINFIGGSSDMVCDDMMDTVKDIIKLYKIGISCINSSNEKYSCDPRSVWDSKNNNSHSDTDAALMVLTHMSRKIQGIFYIRNYLVYARDFLGIKDIVEVNFKDKKRFNKIKIEDAISRYEEAYQYCKNLCSVYTDIRNFSF